MCEAPTNSGGPMPEPMDDMEVVLHDDGRRDDRIRTRLIAEGWIVEFEDKMNWTATPPSQQEWQ